MSLPAFRPSLRPRLCMGGLRALPSQKRPEGSSLAAGATEEASLRTRTRTCQPIALQGSAFSVGCGLSWCRHTNDKISIRALPTPTPCDSVILAYAPGSRGLPLTPSSGGFQACESPSMAQIPQLRSQQRKPELPKEAFKTLCSLPGLALQYVAPCRRQWRLLDWDLLALSIPHGSTWPRLSEQNVLDMTEREVSCFAIPCG